MMCVLNENRACIARISMNESSCLSMRENDNCERSILPGCPSVRSRGSGGLFACLRSTGNAHVPPLTVPSYIPIKRKKASNVREEIEAHELMLQ